MMNSEIAPHDRNFFFMVAGVAIAILLFPYFVQTAAEYFLDYPSSLEEQPPSLALQQGLLKATLVVGSLNVVYAILGAGAIFVGVKTIMGRRFPPAGMSVPIRIRVQNGQTAVVHGFLLSVSGSICLFRAVTFLLFWPWKLL